MMTNAIRKDIRGKQGCIEVQQPSKRANMVAAEENVNTEELTSDHTLPPYI